MKKNRILWCIWMIVLGLMLFAFRTSLILGILILSAVLPVGSFLVSLVCASSIKVKITGPELLTKSEPGKIFVKCDYGTFGKLTTAFCDLEENNLMTGERKTFHHQLGDFQETIVSGYCGKIESSLTGVKITDIWGLLAWRKNFDEAFFTDVIPDFFQQEIETSRAASFDMESVEYSARKPGEDPSEIFDIREYEYGDSLKRIHWKLTSKYDEIMVMRPSLPIDRSIMLFLDLSLVNEGASVANSRSHRGEKSGISPEKIDNLCEVFASISRNLIVQEMKHQICLYDEEIGDAWVYSIEDQEDFAVALSKVLGCRVRKSGEEDSLFVKYMKAPENLPFAHNVICTLREEGEEDIYGGSCISQFIPSEEYSMYEESSVNKQIKFTEAYSEELFHIVI